MLQKNQGPIDRAIRVFAGILLVAVGLFLLGGVEASAVGIVVAAFGVWFTVTGATGRCPLYVPFGISTVGTRHGPFGIGTPRSRHEPSHIGTSRSRQEPSHVEERVKAA